MRAQNRAGAVARVAVCVLLASCTALTPHRRDASETAPLPAQLSNAEFWGIISSFSEKGGSFSSDNFTSNEISVGFLAGELAATGRTGGAYVGVGPEQNFTYIATLRPRIAFIVDIRRQAMVQHLMYKALFEMSSNRAEFISRLFSKPLQAHFSDDAGITELWDAYLSVATDQTQFLRNIAEIKRHLLKTRGGDDALSADDLEYLSYVYGAFFRIGPTISYAGFAQSLSPRARGANFVSLTTTTSAYGTPMSFLGSEEAFRFVKNLHERNLIIPVVGDFGGARALRSVGDYLRTHNTPVTAFYVSNVEQYLFAPNDLSRSFYANVESLPRDEASLFIRPNLSGAQNAAPSWRPDTFMQSNISTFPPVTVDGAVSGPVVDFDPVTSSPVVNNALCRIGPFLNAFREGKVLSFADATRCAS